MEIKRIATDTRRSRAVVYNHMVFVGGQTADDRSQDIRGQTAQTLAKIEKFLAEAGTDKSRLLTAQIWIKDLARDFEGRFDTRHPDGSTTQRVVGRDQTCDDARGRPE